MCEHVCLTHEWTFYYLSHKLGRSQCKWLLVENEAFGIHFELQNLDYFLNNAQFTIKMDHKSLRYLLESPMQIKKIQLRALWLVTIVLYN